MEAVVLKIKERREAMQMSQRDLADRLGVSHVAVCRWEIGVAYLSADRIPAIADILSCTTDALFGRDHKSKNAS